MRSIAHHDHGQKPERMKFLRIIFGCPEGARKWRILFFCYAFASQKEVASEMTLATNWYARLDSNQRPSESESDALSN